MEIKVLTKNGMSILLVKADFNEMLDKNFTEVCEAIANKGKVLKELVRLFEKESDCIEKILSIVRCANGEEKATQFLSEKLHISYNSAQYILNMPIDCLLSLNVKILQEMFEDYKTKISKLVLCNCPCRCRGRGMDSEEDTVIFSNY